MKPFPFITLLAALMLGACSLIPGSDGTIREFVPASVSSAIFLSQKCLDSMSTSLFISHAPLASAVAESSPREMALCSRRAAQLEVTVVRLAEPSRLKDFLSLSGQPGLSVRSGRPIALYAVDSLYVLLTEEGRLAYISKVTPRAGRQTLEQFYADALSEPFTRSVYSALDFSRDLCGMALPRANGSLTTPSDDALIFDASLSGSCLDLSLSMSDASGSETPISLAPDSVCTLTFRQTPLSLTLKASTPADAVRALVGIVGSL